MVTCCGEGVVIELEDMTTTHNCKCGRHYGRVEWNIYSLIGVRAEKREISKEKREINKETKLGG